MVQPAKKGKETANEAGNNGSKRQKVGGSDAVVEVRNPGSKRQTRASSSTSLSDQSPPSTPKKRARSVVSESDTFEEELDGDGNSRNPISEMDAATTSAMREAAIEKRMDLIKRLTEQREKDSAEILYLESGGNMIDYDNTNAVKGKVHMAKEEPQPAEVATTATPTTPIPPSQITTPATLATTPTTVIIPQQPVEVPSKKGPGRPAKDPNAISRKAQALALAKAAAQAQAQAQAQALVQAQAQAQAQSLAPPQVPAQDQDQEQDQEQAQAQTQLQLQPSTPIPTAHIVPAGLSPTYDDDRRRK